MTSPQRGRIAHLSDEDLIRRYHLARDPDDFDALFSRHAPGLLRTCRRYLHDPEESRDAVMQVFEKTLHALPTLPCYCFRSWLYALARNECIDMLRRRRRIRWRQAVYATRESAQNPPPVVSGGWGQDLEQALAQLSEEQRRCIELFYFEEKSYRDIACSTNQSLRSVKSNLQNGRRRLRKLLPGSPPT